MKIVIALVVLAAVVAQAAPLEKLSAKSETEKKALFHDHIVKHSKVYASAQEFRIRYNNFKESLVRIDDRNARDQTATFGLNKFSDMSTAEFKAFYLNDKLANRPRPPMAPRVDQLFSNRVAVNVTAANGDVDWRSKVGQYMGAVRNQQQCGSCWAFSASENIASVWAIAGNEFTVLSVQQIVDCDTSSDGCNGGTSESAYGYVMNAPGLESESSYPYTGSDGTCNFQQSEAVATISSYNTIAEDGPNAISQMKTGVAQVPLSICVEADTWQDYTGGVLSSNCGQNVDHCVILAGYSTSGSQPYWIVRNSWGTDWGEQGYIYVEIGQNLCAIQSDVTTAVA